MERKVIVIVGPTASGKTTLSLNLAEKLNSEIISADSRQFYKYLNIGTAKPTANELLRVQHHLIDNLKPDEYYNVSMFRDDALEIINKLFDKGMVPIVVGGSGLYVRTLVDGIFESPDIAAELRHELSEIRKEKGNEYLYNELLKLDPKAAATLLPQNWKRVTRAIEVFKTSGKSILDLHKQNSADPDIKFFQFGLNWEREVLYKKIENRVDRMIEQGLVNEIIQLLKMGYSADLNSLNTVGYKELIAHLNGEYSLERAIELIKRNTRRYSKRQMTWFRKDDRIKWFNLEQELDLENISKKIITAIKSE